MNWQTMRFNGFCSAISNFGGRSTTNSSSTKERKCQREKEREKDRRKCEKSLYESQSKDERALDILIWREGGKDSSKERERERERIGNSAEEISLEHICEEWLVLGAKCQRKLRVSKTTT